MNTEGAINMRATITEIKQMKKKLRDLRNEEYQLTCRIANLSKQIPKVGDVFLFDGDTVIVINDHHNDIAFMGDDGELLGKVLDLLPEDGDFNHYIFQYNVFAEQDKR